MKVVRNITRYFIFILVIVLIFFTAYWFSTKPIYSGKLELPKLKEEVVVNFDTYGIPHIAAHDEEDMYYAFGYLHAQERLFQMEMVKRLVNGRLAEIIGPDLLKTDQYMRTLGFAQVGKRAADKYLKTTDEKYQKMALAYIDGINEFIVNGKTPIEYKLLGIKKEKFTTADIYNVTSFMALGFSAGLKGDPFFSDIQKKLGTQYLTDWGIAFPEVQPSIDSTQQDALQDTELLGACFEFQSKMDELGMPIWEGSNAWLLSGKRSKSGKPILANDTHIAFSQPSVYYEAHLKCPGYDFYGNFLAGLPFAVIGHNQNLGWGLTIFPVDNLDIYREKVNPNNKNQVWINNQWTTLTSRTETIKIKGEPDYTFDVVSSEHGPIINTIIGREDEAPLSLHWVVLEGETQILKGIYGLNHSTNMEEFQKNRPFVDMIGLNVMYADREGNIAWWPVGKIPKRNTGVNSKLVLDGSNPYNEWLGYLPLKDYPFEINPERGYIVSSNNNPYEGTNKIPGDYHPIYRAKRITELLATKDKWNVEELKFIQTDVYGGQHLEALKSMLVYLGDSTDEEIKILRQWDGYFDLEEIAPTIYSKFLYNTIALMMEDELGKEKFEELCLTPQFDFYNPYFVQHEDSPWWDDITTKTKKETPSEITKKAWQKTILELNKTLGNNQENWKWKHVHILTHVHPIGRKKPFDKLFNVGPFPMIGGNQTVDKMAFVNYADSVYFVRSGAALRTFIDFAAVEAAQSINPTGQSGVVSSKHYQDQALMYNTGQYRGQLMNQDEINRVSSTLLLEPK